MKTLATCNSISANNYFSASSLKERLLSRGPEFLSYRKRPLKFVSSGLQHFVPLRREASTSFLASRLNRRSIKDRSCQILATERVHIFGEHFLIVGDDPIFGSWDVTNAIPLNWADGHQWAAELDIPVGKTIQFKFVLEGNTGNIELQPDPDRTFQPWETTYTIIISEDWDRAELRVLSEEEQIVKQDDESPIIPENLMIENPCVESHRELVNGSCNISALEENGSNVSASKENAEDMVRDDMTWSWWSHMAVKKFLSNLKFL